MLRVLEGSKFNANFIPRGVIFPRQLTAVRQSLQTVLLTPIIATWQLILHTATEGLQQQWQTQIIAAYQQTLATKFPFAEKGDDTQMDDIQHFFHPQTGLLWSFINQKLMPYLQQTPKGWQSRTWLGVGAEFSTQFLSNLSDAKHISDAFFGQDNARPAFVFSVYPEPTAGVREILLTTNGQTYRYRNEPQEWQPLHWPGSEPNDDTVLEIITAKNGSQGNLELNSGWGIFKLLQQAQLKLAFNNALQATWKITTDNGQHYHVSLLIKNNEGENIFNELLLKRFNLPTTLF